MQGACFLESLIPRSFDIKKYTALQVKKATVTNIQIESEPMFFVIKP